MMVNLRKHGILKTIILGSDSVFIYFVIDDKGE